MAVKREKARLSKGILDMKFMKRTKIQVDKEAEEAESRSMYAKEITDKMRSSVSNFVMEPSFVLCEGLLEGRFSFRGMNPEIERLLEKEQAEIAAKKQHVQPTDVSDADMAKFYHAQRAPAAHNAMKRKFNKNKNNNSRNGGTSQKMTKFLKPKDENDST